MKFNEYLDSLKTVNEDVAKYAADETNGVDEEQRLYKLRAEIQKVGEKHKFAVNSTITPKSLFKAISISVSDCASGVCFDLVYSKDGTLKPSSVRAYIASSCQDDICIISKKTFKFADIQAQLRDLVSISKRVEEFALDLEKTLIRILK